MTPFYAQNRAERSLKRGSGEVILPFLVSLFLCFFLLFGSLQGCVNSIHAPDLDAPALPDDPDSLYHILPGKWYACQFRCPLLRHAYSSTKCMILARSLCKIPWQMWCDVPNGPADSYAVICFLKEGRLWPHRNRGQTIVTICDTGSNYKTQTSFREFKRNQQSAINNPMPLWTMWMRRIKPHWQFNNQLPVTRPCHSQPCGRGRKEGWTNRSPSPRAEPVPDDTQHIFSI